MDWKLFTWRCNAGAWGELPGGNRYSNAINWLLMEETQLNDRTDKLSASTRFGAAGGDKKKKDEKHILNWTFIKQYLEIRQESIVVHNLGGGTLMSDYSLKPNQLLHRNSWVFKSRCTGDSMVKEHRWLVKGCMAGGRCLSLQFESIWSTTEYTVRPLYIVNVGNWSLNFPRSQLLWGSLRLWS